MAKSVCTVCGHDGETKTVTPGSILIELVAWLCFLIPGLIYSIWRHSTRHEACASCGSRSLVNSNTKAAATIKASKPSPETHVKCPDCRELVLKDARKCKHCGCALLPQ